jgi:hypothetical protein
VQQRIEFLEEWQKRGRLVELCKTLTAQGARTLVFCETKRGCDEIVNMLRGERITAMALHGDKQQQERDFALAEFKSGRAPLLVATEFKPAVFFEPDTLRVGGGEREAEDEVEGQCDAEAQGEVEGVRVAQEVTLAVTEGEDVAEGVLPRLPLPLGEGDTVTEGRRPVPDTEGEEEGLRVTPPADAVGGAGEPDDEPLTEAQRDVVGDAVGEVDAEAQPLLLTVLRTVRDTEGEPVPHAVTLGV